MHVVTGVTYRRRQVSFVLISVLVGIVCAMHSPTRTLALVASTTASIDPEARTGPAGAAIPHEIHIVPAEPRSESLELSARLAEDGGVIQRPIVWRVRRLDGEVVFAGRLAVVTIAAEPGDYVIEAGYGSVHVAQAVALLKGEQVAVSLVLNVGGIRILSRLSGLELPAVRPLNTVYATSGRDDGKLVAISEEPGEILRLPAGNYRIESRFASGNAIATADVSVKPGLLSSIEIDHRAGVAHLSAGSEATERISWTVRDDKGRDLPVRGTSEIVLVPGRYVGHIKMGNQSRIVSFTVAAGKQIEIVAR